VGVPLGVAVDVSVDVALEVSGAVGVAVDVDVRLGKERESVSTSINASQSPEKASIAPSIPNAPLILHVPTTATPNPP
jgi:hypothetical protein